MTVLATTVFCEDIRQELEGSTSLVGIVPDNLEVPNVPGLMPKLGIYTRIIVPTDADVSPMQVILRFPDGREDSIGAIGEALIKEAFEQARERENPIAGFVNTAMAAPFAVASQGRIFAIVKIGDHEIVTGSVNFVKAA